MAVSNECIVKRAKAELEMLEADVAIFGAAPEEISRINHLKAFIIAHAN